MHEAVLFLVTAAATATYFPLHLQITSNYVVLTYSICTHQVPKPPIGYLLGITYTVMFLKFINLFYEHHRISRSFNNYGGVISEANGNARICTADMLGLFIASL